MALKINSIVMFLYICINIQTEIIPLQEIATTGLESFNIQEYLTVHFITFSKP